MPGHIGISKVSQFVIAVMLLVVSFELKGQITRDTFPTKATLSDCIRYALNNQPAVKQSLLDEQITRQNIRIALSGWFPQLNADANIQHNIKLPVSVLPDFNNPSGPKTEVTMGLYNTSAIQLSASQTFFSSDLLFAGKTSHDLRTLASQNTQSSKIDLIVNVSKAFYDVLLTQQQLNVLDEDIQRLERNYSDAYSQYQSGVTDKIDYQRATIALNNANVEKKSTEESVKVKYAYMKLLMGYPVDKPLEVVFDTSLMEKEILIDTMQGFNYQNRVEYQVMQTNLKLGNALVGYYKWSFIPTLSAFANDNIDYQNDAFPDLYNKSYPNSNFGLKLSFPLFLGTNRLQNIRKANLEYQRMQIESGDLQNQLTTEYTQALASYKSNLNDLLHAKENISIARDIFNTVKLQYDKGIKTYLEVIVSETDLRTAELNYLDALFQVLSSKLNVQKALGDVSIQ